MQLSGAHVLITGASRGIGLAMADAFTAAGATVTLVARSADTLAEHAARLGGHAVAADLSVPDALDGLVAKAEAQAGRPVDVLVSNAAIETSGLADQITEADIESMVHTNLIAPMRLFRQVLPGMLERGHGHVVAISSLAGVFPVPATSIYASTKAGLTHYSNIVWGDLKGTPVGVTTVEPGPVSTPMWDRFVEHETVARAARRLGRMQLIPQESAEKIASDVVRAVQRNKRHLRYPKRLYSSFLLESAPRRLTEALLVGQKPSR
jgi:short-subunit dehydrogenase